MASVSQPPAIQGFSFSPKAAPAMAVSSCLVQRAGCSPREMAVFSSAHQPRGDILLPVPCLVCRCWDHYINNPEILAGSAHWWSVLNWLVFVFPAVDCIRDNWKLMDSFQILLIRVKHWFGCQKDVLELWLRDMVCANGTGDFHRTGFFIKTLSTHCEMLENTRIIT